MQCWQLVCSVGSLSETNLQAKITAKQGSEKYMIQSLSAVSTRTLYRSKNTGHPDLGFQYDSEIRTMRALGKQMILDLGQEI